MLVGLAHTSMIIWWIVTSPDSLVGTVERAVTSFYMVLYLLAHLTELVHMMSGFNSSRNKNAQSVLSSRMKTSHLLLHSVGQYKSEGHTRFKGSRNRLHLLMGASANNHGYICIFPHIGYI